MNCTSQWSTPAVDTECWLGVDRGIYNLAALAVVDSDGRVFVETAIDGKDLRERQRARLRAISEGQRLGRSIRDRKRRSWAEHAVHGAANRIVAFALEHRAQVVLEDPSALSAMGKKPRVLGRRRSSFNRLLTRKQYEKLAGFLGYKLRAVGLPDPIFVRAAGTSTTCPECAHQSRENREIRPAAGGFETSVFKCTACGYTADADANAARVIGLKGAWLQSLPRKPKRLADGRLADELQWSTYLQRAAERRVDGVKSKSQLSDTG